MRLFAPSCLSRVDLFRRAVDPFARRVQLFSTTITAMSGTEAVLAQIYSASVRPNEIKSKSPEDVGLKSHHLEDGKGFCNPWDSWRDLRPVSAIKTMAAYRWTHGLYGPDTTPPTVPVVKPQFPSSRSTSSSEFRATWLGHASFYVEFPGGLRVLTDPVFSERCSPVQFMGPKRYTKKPCDISDIPVVDAVLISHNHYDHLDVGSIQQLRKHHPKAWYFVPQGNKQWFTSMGIQQCTEMDWWEENDFILTPSNSEQPSSSASTKSSVQAEAAPAVEGNKASDIRALVGCLPCQHTSNRGLRDRGVTLWSSWSVESGGKKLYFGGDTGYRAVPELPDGVDDYGEEFKHLPVCPAFKQIGEHRGPFDLGLIPIGAYIPRGIMSPVHANPMDAVNIFIDTKCKKALGMHWGTWVLTEEKVTEPPQLLKDSLEKKGIEKEGIFGVLDIGASKAF